MNTANNLDVKTNGNSLQLNASANSISFPRTETNICQLNDDCLVHIFKYLICEDLLDIARSSDRFHHAVGLCFRNNYAPLDCYQFYKRLSNQEQKKLLSVIGTDIKVITSSLWESDSNFELLCTFCPNVTKLTFQRTYGPNKLNQLIMSMQMITELKLPDCNGCVDDLDILTLKNLPQLKKLTVRSNKISGKYLSDLKILQLLNLKYCYKVQSNYLIEILKELVDLQALNIDDCGAINLDVCQQMVQCSKLESLQMDYPRSGFEFIARLPSLKYLTIAWHYDSDDTPEKFAKMFTEMATHAHQLENLTLDQFKDLPPDLDCLKNLKVLRLNIFYFENDNWLKCFSKMENLQKLIIKSDRFTIEDGLLHLLTNCKRLRHVEIESFEVNSISHNFVHKTILMLRNTIGERILPVTLILGDVYDLEMDEEYDEAEKDGIIKIDFTKAWNNEDSSMTSDCTTSDSE